ncbi:hypothetical protein WICPIJ_003150 [Wickerhamomyces pijperi]|uniref:Uncharacterized protein n=1 Tax=Wickerhamomyces pijperi TaxID=599730 RepID=A0A9P8Q7L5_WICPI|nr:hypothetical protein WICPIJ_003150 [Wickerhamomyces pijperi]
MIVDTNKLVTGDVSQVLDHGSLTRGSWTLDQDRKLLTRCGSDQVQHVLLNKRSDDIVWLVNDLFRALSHPVMLELNVQFIVGAWVRWDLRDNRLGVLQSPNGVLSDQRLQDLLRSLVQ